MTTVGSRLYGKYKILSCVYRTNISINWLREMSSFKLESYSERAIKTVVVAWVGDRTGMQCSVRSSSLDTVPYSNEKSINLLPFFLRCAAFNHYSATTTKNRICDFQLRCIEFTVPRTNFSIKQPRGENGLLQNRTRSTLSKSVSATTKPGVVCPRHLQECDRRDNACPPVAYISDFIRVSPHVFQFAEK